MRSSGTSDTHKGSAVTAALSAALDAEQPRDAVIALLLEKVLANGLGAAPPAAPQPATTNAAAVLTLNVSGASPPVPTTSTMRSTPGTTMRTAF